MKKVYFIFLLLIFFRVVNGQDISIKGKVTDSETGEGIPFANVAVTNVNRGTVTDFEGYYTLKVPTNADSIVVIYLGYQKKAKPIKKGVLSQVIDFQLAPDKKVLQEVYVVAGENPAFRIIRKAVENKDNNDKRKLLAYEYEAYSKIEISVDNISEKFRKRKLMSKMVQIFDSLKIAAGEDGKPILPVFMSEAVSNYYHRREPDKTKEIMVATNIKGVGVDDGSVVSQLIGSTFQDYNFYKNWITVLNKDFISPIADGWNGYYNYLLTDSTFIDSMWCYKIEFKPKRPQDLAFNGHMWITDSTFAIKQIDVTIAKEANINYIDKVKVQQELVPTETGAWIPSKVRIIVDIDEIGDNSPGMLAKYYSSNRNIKVNDPKPPKFYEVLLEVAEDARMKDQSYWDTARHDSLTPTEKHIYAMIDTVRNVPMIKTYVEVVNVIVNGYKKMGKIDVGPYLFAYAFNNVEGHRLRIGFRTNADFSKKFVFRGYAGIGTADLQDNLVKYGIKADYIMSRKPWTVLSIERKRDIDQLGVQSENLAQNNLFLAFTRWGILRGPYLGTSNSINFQTELRKDFTQKIGFRRKTFEPLFPFAFYKDMEHGDFSLVENLHISEINLESRITKDEVFIQNDNERVSLGTLKWPVLTMRYTYGMRGVLGSQFQYHKVNLQFDQMLKVGVFGRIYYNLNAGRIFSKVPYPILEIHQGNETPFYTTAAFNLMNYFEFISDTYASLKYRHYLEGLFFNRIPAIKKLKWRFLVSSNVLFGGLSQRNREIISKVDPSGLPTPNFSSLSPGKPYVEVGYGIENIFKIFRVDAFHRVTYTDRPGISRFGVKVSVQFIL
ncbi:MAG: DUF5686 family protein [Cytophagaceae bacterium]